MHALFLSKSLAEGILVESKEPVVKNRKMHIFGWSLAACVLITAMIFFFLRNTEITIDAYVQGNQIKLTPQVNGIVNSIWTDDTFYVKQGQLLIELDKTDATIALDKASADLGQAVRQVVQMFQQVLRLEALVIAAKADVEKTRVDYEDRLPLVDTGAVSKEDFIHAKTAFEAASAQLIATELALLQAKSEVGGTTVRTHPLVLSKAEIVRQAFVNLDRCTILSPSDGIVSQRGVQVGQQVAVGDLLLSIVPMDQIWVYANFKEIHLSRIRVGQEVKVYSDIYKTQVAYRGKVVGLAGGTGAVFSVLPPQNATGNWIKIVQRLAVRIDLDPEQIKQYPLRLGLSMFAVVDVKDQQGPRIPLPCAQQPVYKTYLYPLQEDGSTTYIEKIITDNLYE